MFVIVPYQGDFTPWAWWENAFSEEQLNVLEAEASLADQEAQTGIAGEGRINRNMRRSMVRWIGNNDQQFRWMWATLSDVVSRMNAQFFRLDLSCFGEPAQLARYEESDEGEYGWHQDHGAITSRKLSLAIQLSDPDSYEGGDFEFLMGEGDIQKPRRQRGLIVAFPSYQMHRVTCVKKGIRHSLVVWVTGPSFR